MRNSAKTIKKPDQIFIGTISPTVTTQLHKKRHNLH